MGRMDIASSPRHHEYIARHGASDRPGRFERGGSPLVRDPGLWYLLCVTRTNRRRSKRRLAGWAALAAAAVAAPAVAHALIQRRLRAPDALGWGRTHRYAGHFGPVVFRELGAGPPIVLLHALGPGYDSLQWGPAAEALAGHFRVLAPDLPGWGRSAPVEPRPELYLASLAEFLIAVVRDPAVLVGAGHAAPFAVCLGAELPDQIRALALVAPAGRFSRIAMAPGAAGEAARAGAAGAAGQLPAGQLVADLLAVPWLRVSATPSRPPSASTPR